MDREGSKMHLTSFLSMRSRTSRADGRSNMAVARIGSVIDTLRVDCIESRAISRSEGLFWTGV